MSNHYAVTATDGGEKKVMYGGQIHVLPAGETRVFPDHIAFHFEHYHTREVDGVAQCSVKLELADDQVARQGLVPGNQLIRLPCPWPDCTQECLSKDLLATHHRTVHLQPLLQQVAKGEAVEATLIEVDAFKQKCVELQKRLDERPVLTRFACCEGECGEEAKDDPGKLRSFDTFSSLRSHWLAKHAKGK